MCSSTAMAGSKIQVTEEPSFYRTRHFYFIIAGFVLVAAVVFQSFNTQSEPASDKVYEFDDELRILLVGKTGVGKSATGNTILRKKAFVSEFSSSSVTSQCEKVHGNVNGRKVAVIDSPGLFDTNLTVDDVINRIKLCVPLSAPGPHVFVVVIKLGRFTDEDENTVAIFQEIFGKESSRYTMVLFTHGDQLKGKNIHQFVRDNPKLLTFIKKCNGRYHLFNNEDENPEQVIQLLDQIDKIVTANGGGHYNTEMLEEAERAIEAEKERILKENEAKRLQEIEELRKQLVGEALEARIIQKNNEYFKNAREQAERSSSWFDRLKSMVKQAVTKIKTLLSKLF